MTDPDPAPIHLRLLREGDPEVMRGRIYDGTGESGPEQPRPLPLEPMMAGCACGQCYCGPVAPERCAEVLHWRAVWQRWMGL